MNSGAVRRKMGDDRPFVCSAPGCGQVRPLIKKYSGQQDRCCVDKHLNYMTIKLGILPPEKVVPVTLHFPEGIPPPLEPHNSRFFPMKQ